MTSLLEIQREFDDFLLRGGANFHRTADKLASRVGIRKATGVDRWCDHYSPLVVRYPVLQSLNSFSGAASPAVSDSKGAVATAHLHFLIHAFVEDRILDGQIVLDAEEAAFVEAVSREANAVLVALCEGLEPERDWRNRLISGYVYAQRHGYEVPAAAGPARMHRARLRKVACGRGYLGALIPLALAAHVGADARTLRRMKNAFDCLMLGLQWLDDLSDWPEDVENADINLMLSVLRSRGPDPYAHPPNEVRLPNVAYALLDGRYFEHAAEQSKRWLAAARDRQEALGCHELARLIEERRQAVDRMAQNAADDASNRVLAQCITDIGAHPNRHLSFGRP